MDTRQATATQTAATGCWLGCGLVDRTIPPGGLIKDQVAFPSPEAILVPQPLGHVRSCALLSLIDGTVWMLALPGKAWTRSRALSAASVLAEASAGAGGDAEPRLRQLPGLEAITVETPHLRVPDPEQWDIHGVAAALIKRGQSGLSSSRSPRLALEQIPSVETALLRELTAALGDFVAGMDAEVLAAASAQGALDAARYNYLIRQPFRAYRLQFAATFPSLVPATVAGAPGTLGAELRGIVDQGSPLVKGLAGRWGVRPGVVRHLVGRPADLVGAYWVRRPRELAVLLNALHPEDVPAEAAEAWEEFNRAVAIGHRLFRKPVWQSPAALQWLRESLRHGRRAPHANRLHWLPSQATLGEIGRFRDALTSALVGEAGGATVSAVHAQSAACDQLVDRFLSDSARRGLGIMAADFQCALANLRQQLRDVKARASRVASGDEMWPLIPADFISADGTRIVRPLRTYEELKDHGAALGNCLGRGYAFRYLRKGSQGTTFVVGLFDAATGAPCSTADIAIKHYAETHSYDLAIVQHTARENAEPSLGCILAVEELLRYCRGAEVRRHLAQGWRLLAARGSRRSRHHDQVEDLATVRMALRLCLGDRIYDGLLGELLQAPSKTSFAERTPA